MLHYEIPVSQYRIEDHCNNAIVFDMNSLMKMTDYVESCSDDMTTQDDYKKPHVFGHFLDGCGCELVKSLKTISEDASLFPVVYFFELSISVIKINFPFISE